MKILAIETSCDETAIALVEAKGGIKQSRFRILKNLVASQVKIHRPFGGVVPNLAKREHIRNLPILLGKISKISNFQFLISNQFSNFQFQKLQKFFNKIDLIAVTVGPGLEPALWTGIGFAKELYYSVKRLASSVKIIGVSHLEGHLYSFLLQQKRVNPKSKILNPKQKNLEIRVSNLEFPAIALLVSGGHTILLLMKNLTTYKKLGETRDDAVGEAFDKVARLLNLPYPGGPEIEKLAKKGDANAIQFPRPMLNQKNYDFSFSGLKTAILYYLKRFNNTTIQQFKPDVAASFQSAAFDVLISKTLRAAKEFQAKSIMISGGVAVNKTLQKEFKLKIANLKLKINFLAPPKNFCTDNAVMIAAAGYINELQKKKRRLVAKGDLDI